MKTLTEQLYEYLLKEGNPMTVIDVIKNESFTNVPPMVVGKGLLTICGEGLANYFMKDGKMYFTTDLSVGRGPIGSQSNMGNLTGALSALFGGASGDMSSFLGNMTKAFPDVGDSETDALIEAISFTAKAKGDDFEIAFPADPSEDLESDGEHEFVAVYENLPIASMTTKVNVVDGDFSEKAMKATIRGLCMNNIKKLYKCLDAPEEYANDNTTAFYLPASPNCFAFVARPDGIHILRIDWNFENGLPSKKVVFKFFERWLNTYKYFGEKQYTQLLSFDREELLKAPITSDTEEKILGEFENWLNEANRQANVIKASAGSEDGIDKPTIFFYRARKSLEEAAEIIDAVIVQATNVIKHYSTVKANEEFLNKLYTFAQITLDVASDISASIKVNVSNIPYNSATDIALGASSTEDRTVQVFPTHYLEFLDLITTQRMAIQATDAELQANIKAFAKEMKARYDIANKAPVYYPDFKMEGKMVAAYLGHAEEVEVPEFATHIGDYSFKNAKEMVSIVLGESVTSFGFCPFDGCSNLKVVKVLGDVAAINGPLTGFGGNPKFTIQSYKGSYIEKYCKENEVAFEAIKEDNLDCVIELNKTEYDVYQGFAFPKIVGFKTTQELSSADKKKLSADENTEHIQYGMVPTDNSFAEYKDVNFSVTVVQDPLDVPQGGIQIAEEIEQRFNQPTLHGVYRTVKADKGKVLVRYDTTREGNDEGVQWATYVVVVARENKLLIMQIFFNGDYSHRQQQFAIDKWAGQILTEKAYKDKQKKLQEELRKAEEARNAEKKKRLEEERKETERIRKEKEAAEKAEAERIARQKAKELREAANKMRGRYIAASGMIASSLYHVVALKPDGTVIATGKNDNGQCNVSGWRNVIAVACDTNGTVGLTAQGTVLYTGSTYHRQNQCTSWRNIKEIAISNECIFGLRYDGTVVATTEGSNGAHFSTKPDVTTWRNIVAIRAGQGNVLGIKSDGSIVAIQRNYYGRCEEDYYMDGKTNAQDAAFGYLACGVILHKDGKCTSAGTQYSYVMSPTEINKHSGIVKIDMFGSRPIAILADGTLVVEPGKNDKQKELEWFISKHNIKKVVAVSCDGQFAVLTEDGRVFVKCDLTFSPFTDEECFGKNFRLFNDFHKMMDAREAEAERIRKEQEEQERLRKEEERRRADRRQNGLCQYCGGTFKKVLFGMKCTSCGTKKDYK